MKIGFYLLGKKGLEVLSSFLDKFGSQNVSFVVIAKDKKISIDYSDDIERLCIEYQVSYLFRCELKKDQHLDSSFNFAIGWRWLINKSDNLIVLHDSLLPKYRGFAPLVNMLINKEPNIGVTALLASSEYDKGDIIGQLSIPVDYPTRIQEAIQYISALYVDLVLSIAETLFTGGELARVKQIEDHASYSLWRDESDYEVDWSQSSEYIQRFVDAVSFPYLGAVSFAINNKVRIHRVEHMQDVIVEDRMNHIGKIIFFKNGNPCVICGKGIVMISDVTYEGEEGKSLSNFSFRTRFTSGRTN